MKAEYPPREENSDSGVMHIVNRKLGITDPNNIELLNPKDQKEQVSTDELREAIISDLKNPAYKGDHLLEETISEKTSFEVPQKKEGSPKKGKVTNALVGFLGSLAMLIPSNAKAEKTDTDKDAKQKYGLVIYTEAKTKEGSITPTGKSNSFLENPYNITEADLKFIGQKHGFDISSNASFQNDLFNYVESAHPDIIEKLLIEYHLPNAGKLRDNLLGARVAYTIHLLQEEPLKPSSEHPLPPESKETTSIRFDSAFVVNVRGDQSTDGAFYVLPDKKTFSALADQLPSQSMEERATYGQITIDMNNSVFLENYATSENIKNLLGPRYTRDPNDAKRLRQVKDPNQSTQAHYYDGIARSNK